MGMNKEESVFDLAVVNGVIVTMSKELYEKIKKDLQAYKDDNETMTITIRDLNQSHFKILNDLKSYKDKEDKLLKDITTMNDYIKEIRITNEKLQTNAIHNKKVMDNVNWKIKRVKGYCNDNIYELTAFEGRKELEHILQILNEGSDGK